MKNKLLALIVFSLIGSTLAWSQNSAVQTFFERYEDDPEFSVVEISPAMFRLMSRIEVDEDGELDELINTVTGLKILIRDGEGYDLYDQAFEELSKVKFEELLKVRDKKENIRFMVNEGSNDIINELILLVGGDSSFVMLDLTGNIKLRTIGKLGKSLDVPGSEHLEKLNKN